MQPGPTFDRKQETALSDICSQLYERLEPKDFLLQTKDDEDFNSYRVKMLQWVDELLEKTEAEFEDLEKVKKVIIEAVTTYGPLAEFMFDPDVNEIMANRHDEVFVEKKGKLLLTGKQFISTSHFMKIIQRILYPLGRILNENQPMVDARLPDGSRINVIIPPLALQSPLLTIRKFILEIMSIKSLLNLESLSPEMAEFLKVAVQTRRNIIVSGGTAAGKTTLLNILSSFIPPHERIITIEDAAEMKLSHFHICRLETKPPDMNGRGGVSTLDLFRNSLRMRPDRIVVGECRGAEALAMLQAMNSGHDGSMTTAHANSPKDLLARIETMASLAGANIPHQAIRHQIAAAIDLVVHLQRYPEGTRKIKQITEITGMEGGTISRADIFQFEQTGSEPNGKPVGTFRSTGIVPKFFEEIGHLGIRIPIEVF